MPPSEEALRARLHAVHDDDLERLVSNLGLAADLARGTLRCRLCDEIVTLATLGALFPGHGNIYAVCAKPVCMQRLTREQDEVRHG